METQKTAIKPSSVIKFILFSLLGVFVFFVNIPFQGGKAVPITVLKTLLKGLIGTLLPYLVLILCLYCMYDIYFIKKTYKGKPSDKVFTVFKTMGLILTIMVILGIGPAVLLNEEIGPYAVNLLGDIAIMVGIGAFMLPLLTDFGLANAIGVILRPIMRPLFKVPGSTCVVAVTEHIGSYSYGAIAMNKMYNEGKVTAREAANVMTSFGTVTIVLLMVFANIAGITEYWTTYFILVTAVLLLLSIITVRIFPLSKIKDEYKEGVTPAPEKEYNKHILKNAWLEGVTTAQNAPGLLKIEAKQAKNVLPMLGGMMTSGVFFVIVGLLLKNYTPVISWIGYVFYPILKLAGFSDAALLTQSCAISILDPMCVLTFIAGQELLLVSRFMVATLGVTALVFFAGFVPCALATDVPFKISHLIILWFIRVVLTILLVGLFGLIFL